MPLIRTDLTEPSPSRARILHKQPRTQTARHAPHGPRGRRADGWRRRAAETTCGGPRPPCHALLSRAVHARPRLAPLAAWPAFSFPVCGAAANTHQAVKFGSLILGGMGGFPVVRTLGQYPITFPAMSRALIPACLLVAGCCPSWSALEMRVASGPVGFVTFLPSCVASHRLTPPNRPSRTWSL